MLRRSLRLQEGNYYTEQGSPSVSYKERLYRVFRRRFSYNRNNQRQNVSSNHEPQGHGDYIAPYYHQLDNQQDANNHATTGTQTVRPKRKKVKTTRSSSFHFGLPLLLLLAFGLTHMWLQMAELKQEVQSLKQRLHTVSPPADTIPNFALKSQGASVILSLSSDTYWPNSLETIMDSIFSWWYMTKRQTGVIWNPDKDVFTCVKLQIENNWGNTDFTCLYSFRVHGNAPTQYNFF